MILTNAEPKDISHNTFEEFRDSLFANGLVFATGTDGVYGYSASYERIVNAVDQLIHDLAGSTFELVHFPPILARGTFDRTGYLDAFPDLMGSVQVFQGDDRKHRELTRRYEEDGDWSQLLDPAEVVLSSAACHSLYPMCSGRLPAGGRYLEIENWCFRHEPSTDAARMMAFRMHELVYVGDPLAAQDHRDTMLSNGVTLLTDLGLPMATVPANDPFFGRLGNILASTQLEENLKLEGVTPIYSHERPTAIISGNCAREHFGEPFGIETYDGDVAHTSCVAFGIDRITLALLSRYGMDLSQWPINIQRRLWG